MNTLDTIKRTGIGCKLKVAFTTGEEIGQTGANKIDPEFFDGIDFAISLDRRGTTDIVIDNGYDIYCDHEDALFIEAASKHLWLDPQYHYKPVSGGVSDLIVWSKMGIPSVNLSIGYQGEHYPGETIDLDAWHRTHELLLESIYKFTFRKRSLVRDARWAHRNK